MTNKTSDSRRRQARAATIVLSALFTIIAGSASAQVPNVARGCPYTMTPRPNYSLTTDPADDRQLTDGAYTDWNPIWLRPSTVGWANASTVTIVIDLRSVQPISSVSFRAAAGTAGVEWPRSIFVLVSDDGQHFFPVGDLADIPAASTARPPATGYGAFRYTTPNLDTHGRYVALIVDPNGSYVFSDEIEVLAGDPAGVGLPLTGASTTDLQDFFVRAHMRVSIQRRLSLDFEAARAALARSQAAVDVDHLSRELDAIAAGIDALVTPDPQTFAAVLPLNDLHSRIFAVQGEIAHANGLPELTAWAVNPWDFVRPLDKPPAANLHDGLSIVAMNGETRAGAINVSNSTGQPMVASLNLSGLTTDASDTDLHMSEVLWTDTRELVPVADALVPLDESRPSVVFPAGLTRQIWLTFTPHRRAPGVYRGYLELTRANGAATRVPVELRVLDGSFPHRPTLHLGGWDYTNATNLLGLTPDNTPVLIDRMRALGVDSPWATNAVVPSGRFDAAGHLSEAPGTALFDGWLAKWPDVSAYFIFVDAQDTFGNVSRADSTRFATALGQWITFWVQHAAGLGIRPSQLVLLLVDEPHLPAQDDRIVVWTSALKAAQPAVRIWEDPTYRDPVASQPMLLDIVDVIGLKSWLMVQQGPWFVDFYRKRGERGQELAVYGASGPARLVDPYTYQRLQAWMCADVGAQSSFFWSFSDDAAGHSWNEYATTKAPYSPFFLSSNQVVSSKHSEAIREGAEDFEYIEMLRQRVSALAQTDPNRPGLANAAAFLAAAITSVLQAPGATNTQWAADKDRSPAERVRLAIASTLDWLATNPVDGDNASIGRAVPSITVTGGTFAYDGNPHPAVAAATGAYGVPVPGSFAITYAPGGSTPPTHGGTYSVSASFTSGDPNYADVRANSTIVVVETTRTTVSASASDSVFGQAVTFAAVVAGAGSAPPGIVQFRLDGQPVGSGLTLVGGTASITIDSPAPGRHIVSAEYGGNDGFTTSSGAIDHTVVRATPIIGWTAESNIPFGTALDAIVLNASASVSGTFVYTPPAGTLLPAGWQQLGVTFVPTDAVHYDPVTKSVMLNVTPATPMIVAAASVTVTYDGAAHPLAAAATGIGGGPVAGWFAIAYSPGGSSAPVNAGSYSAAVTFHSADPNYSDATAVSSITINPAPVVATMTYPLNGSANADLTIPIQWTAVINVQAYYLYIGSTPGAKDLVNTGEFLTTSYRVAKYLPARMLYARVWAKVAGVWRYTDSSFTARPLAATLIYPLSGAMNVDLSTPVQWTPIENTQAFYLYVGSTPGAKDLVNTGEILATSYRISRLPAGQTVYVRLWTKLGGVWRYVDSTFSAAP